MKDKKRQIFIIGLFVVFLGINGIWFYCNQKLQRELAESQEGIRMLQEQKEEWERESVLLKEEVSERSDFESAWKWLENGYTEKIQRRFALLEVDKIGVCPLGADSEEQIRRFYLCRGDGQNLEFYMADYLSGKIFNLNHSMPWQNSSYTNRWKAENLIDWGVLEEDFDNNGMADILLVTIFGEEGKEYSRVFLWMQVKEEFFPINSSYCGEMKEWYNENNFSWRIAQFQEKQNLENWSAVQAGIWVKEELFKGREKELSMLLSDFEQDKYSNDIQEIESLTVNVIQDSAKRYQVQISENPYSEGRINAWLLEFYQTDQEEKTEFLGVGITESDVALTEQERKEAGYFYDTNFQIMRADGAVISFQGSNTTRPGRLIGSYLPNVLMFSVNFDTKSGKVLRPEDIFWDMEGFCGFAAEYIKENFADQISDKRNYIEDGFWGDGWCFTEDGIMLFQNCGEAGGTGYLIPYELITDYIKTDYIPVF